MYFQSDLRLGPLDAASVADPHRVDNQALEVPDVFLGVDVALQEIDDLGLGRRADR